MAIAHGGTTLTGTTDGQGKTYLYNLEPGDWTVSEEARVGWRLASGYEK